MIPTVVISNNINNVNSNCFKTIFINGITICYNAQFEKEYYIFENSDYQLFAHVNIGFKNTLSQFTNDNFSKKDIEELQKKMKWGFIIIISPITTSSI